jgi:hypothetical protein
MRRRHCLTAGTAAVLAAPVWSAIALRQTSIRHIAVSGSAVAITLP